MLGRDLTHALLDGRRDAQLQELRREILVAPSAQPLDTLLGRLRAEHTSIAAVLDEYGVLDGVVTVEDIVEELVGEIWDEDDRLPGVRRLADGTLVVAGDGSLADLALEGILIDGGSSMSIGGLIQDRLGRVPQRGDSVTAGDRVLKVLSTEGQRVRRVAIRPLRPPPA